MMVSTRGRYALRVLVDLAEQDSDRYITLREIAGGRRPFFAWMTPSYTTTVSPISQIEKNGNSIKITVLLWRRWRDSLAFAPCGRRPSRNSRCGNDPVAAVFVRAEARKRLKSRAFQVKRKARQFYQNYRAFMAEMERFACICALRETAQIKESTSF